MKILYLVDFWLRDTSGLGRTTRHKSQALEELGHDVFLVGSCFKNQYLRKFMSVLLDIYSTFLLVFYKPDLIISRGSVGVLTLFVGRVIGILTVREVHAYMLEEVQLLRYKRLQKFLLSAFSKLSHRLDVSADLRIFNHPDLLRFYHENGFAKRDDFYVYNGAEVSSISTLSKQEARARYGLSDNVFYLVFVGSAAKWHGIEYLVALQQVFDQRGDSIRIIVGGGNISDFDPSGTCLNISPLDANGCSDLISAADMCLLPVKSSRVSPGSPLKLYEYIVNKRFVIGQSDILGYSDEINRHGVGFCVDFTSPENARDVIVKKLKSIEMSSVFPRVDVSWRTRMKSWVEGIEHSISQKEKFRN